MVKPLAPEVFPEGVNHLALGNSEDSLSKSSKRGLSRRLRDMRNKTFRTCGRVSKGFCVACRQQPRDITTLLADPTVPTVSQRIGYELDLQKEMNRKSFPEEVP